MNGLRYSLSLMCTKITLSSYSITTVKEIHNMHTFKVPEDSNYHGHPYWQQSFKIFLIGDDEHFHIMDSLLGSGVNWLAYTSSAVTIHCKLCCPCLTVYQMCNSVLCLWRPVAPTVHRPFCSPVVQTMLCTLPSKAPNSLAQSPYCVCPRWKEHLHDTHCHL